MTGYLESTGQGYSVTFVIYVYLPSLAVREYRGHTYTSATYWYIIKMMFDVAVGRR